MEMFFGMIGMVFGIMGFVFGVNATYKTDALEKQLVEKGVLDKESE